MSRPRSIATDTADGVSYVFHYESPCWRTTLRLSDVNFEEDGEGFGLE
jgi:hypothetical protein